MQSPAFGKRAGMLESILEVAAMHHQIGAEGAHGGVLLAAVALGHHHRHPLAGLPRGIGDGLAVIAARRSHHALGLALCHVGQPAADLEGADGRVVLMLDPDFGAGALCEKGPDPLRSRREGAVNQSRLPPRFPSFRAVSWQFYRPAEIRGRPPGNHHPVPLHRAGKASTAHRHLPSCQSRLAEAIRPVGRERAVRGARHRVFVYPGARREAARHEIDLIAPAPSQR